MYALIATTSSLNAISGAPVFHAATCVAPLATPTSTPKFVARAVTPCMSGWPALKVPRVLSSNQRPSEYVNGE
jgi:hypothetical protein